MVILQPEIPIPVLIRFIFQVRFKSKNVNAKDIDLGGIACDIVRSITGNH